MRTVRVTDRHTLHYPLLAAPFYDGIPTRIVHGMPTNIVNRAIKDIIGGLPAFEGMVAGDEIEQLYSVPTFTFWVYDIRTRAVMPFEDRLDIARDFVGSASQCVRVVPYQVIISEEGLSEFLDAHESIIIREPDAIKGSFYLMETTYVEALPDSPAHHDMPDGNREDEVE